MPSAGDPIILAKMPGYQVGTASSTSDSSTFTTTETEIGTITVSLISGVVYEVACNAPISSSGTGDIVSCRIREDNVSGTEMTLDTKEIVNATNPTVFPLKAFYTAASTGSKTFSVTGDRESGANNIR